MGRPFDDDNQDLALETRRQEGATVVTLRGEVTVFSSPALREALRQVAAQRPGRVVLDLSETHYVDSSGVATLVDALRMVRASGGKMVLAAVRERVRGVIEIARLDAVFTMAASVEEALKP